MELNSDSAKPDRDPSKSLLAVAGVKLDRTFGMTTLLERELEAVEAELGRIKRLEERKEAIKAMLKLIDVAVEEDRVTSSRNRAAAEQRTRELNQEIDKKCASMFRKP